MDTPELPSDLIPVNEAIRLLPGQKPGRTPHIASLYRWVQEGRLRGWKVAGRLVVSRAEVLGLIRPVVPRRPKPGCAAVEATRRQQDAETDRILARFGLG